MMPQMDSMTINRLISTLMLFVVVLSMTSSTIGEFRSHSLSMASVASHDYSHSSSHSHASESEQTFHHDASNHHHTYDGANLRSLVSLSLIVELTSISQGQPDGRPLYEPFLIKRPPRDLLVV